MSIRVVTTLCELEKTLDRLAAASRALEQSEVFEPDYRAALRPILSGVSTALDQLRHLVAALSDDLGHVEHITRRADRREIPASFGGRR